MGHSRTQHVSLSRRTFVNANSGSPVSQARRWFESEFRHLLDGGLSQSCRCRHCISVCYQLPALCSLRGWWPRSNGGALLQTTPARGGSLDGATISVQEVRQPGLCNCPLVAVSVTLPLKTWHIVFRSARGSRICERSGA